METFKEYANLALRGGFILKSVRSQSVPMTDALSRPALARTTIVGVNLEIELDARLTTEEVSISLYHGVLEAATVTAVCDLNEAGFESAAFRLQAQLGTATPATLNRMLELFGF